MFPRRPFTSTITTDHVYVNVPESERVNSIYWIVFSVRVKICLKSGFSDTIHIDKNDYALVIEVRGNSQGWLPKDAWEWIQKNIQN
ncbi:MAG: hypothetical protein ABSE08_13865 [Syntrophobacteraceae bacterium]|jgi:hypothetical protein